MVLDWLARRMRPPAGLTRLACRFSIQRSPREGKTGGKPGQQISDLGTSSGRRQRDSEQIGNMVPFPPMVSLVRTPPSATSAEACAPLFGDFIGNTARSDSSSGVRVRRAALGLPGPVCLRRHRRGLPVLVHAVSQRAWGPRLRGITRRPALPSARVWPSPSGNRVGVRRFLTFIVGGEKRFLTPFPFLPPDTVSPPMSRPEWGWISQAWVTSLQSGVAGTTFGGCNTTAGKSQGQRGKGNGAVIISRFSLSQL